jgi:hypothetical protein
MMRFPPNLASLRLGGGYFLIGIPDENHFAQSRKDAKRKKME